MMNSLRSRLTAWYLGFFSLLFLLFCVLLYGGVSRALGHRVDELLAGEASTAASLLQEELEEMHGDAPAAAADVLSELKPKTTLVAFFEGPDLLAASPGAPRSALISAARRILAHQDAGFDVADWGSHGARAAARRATFRDRSFSVLTVEPLDSLASDLQVFRRTLAIAFPLVLVLAGAGGYLLTRRSLAPLAVMAEQAKRITGENLKARLEIGNAAEELRLLAASFNEVLSRLDQSFETTRRFVLDASHEMRTPLAVIRGETDVALSRDRETPEYKESLALIQDESRRLSRLVEDLLNLARADAGRVELRLQDIYLNDLLADCCRTIQSLAVARGVEIQSHCLEDVPFRGDEELLRRMVLNLLDNAIRYTQPGGRVSASLEVRGPQVRIEVADTGEGIGPEDSARVFERFYRADKARSRQLGGFGLGLAIVKWIAESHQGDVELSSRPGQGSTFTVRLRRA